MRGFDGNRLVLDKPAADGLNVVIGRADQSQTTIRIGALQFGDETESEIGVRSAVS